MTTETTDFRHPITGVLDRYAEAVVAWLDTGATNFPVERPPREAYFLFSFILATDLNRFAPELFAEVTSLIGAWLGDDQPSPQTRVLIEILRPTLAKKVTP